MFDPPTAALAAPPAALSEQQQSDLDCLSVSEALLAATRTTGPNPQANRMIHAYLFRLQRSDEARDWMTMITPPDQMAYGWYLARLQECRRPFRPYVRPVRPLAAP